MSIIPPRTLKGFRDLLPSRAHRQMKMVRTLQDVFFAYGYAPIETPVLELAEILKGKGGEDSDRELFEFTDKGGREVAMRFDLTVPLARFIAQHQGDLAVPFRRSHVGLCWRGERPQRGRAREFLQCDADILGATGVLPDAEILVLMLTAYERVGAGPITIRVNDRRILNAMLGRLGLADKGPTVLRVVDKFDKLGRDVVLKELVDAGLSSDQATALIEISTPGPDDAATLRALEGAVDDEGKQAIDALRQVRDLVLATGRDASSIRIDPMIARGLDYYTGMVLEAQHQQLPEIGSVGSGGRYDNLARLYTKTDFPGVGCSIGVTRLLDALEAIEGERAARDGVTEVMIAYPEHQGLRAAFKWAETLRAAGIATEIFPIRKKHGQQMRHANRRNIAYVVTLNEDTGAHIKRMTDGETTKASSPEAALPWLRKD